MADKFNYTKERLTIEMDYILDQKLKYKKLAKIFKSKIFGNLGRRFEMKYRIYSYMWKRFVSEHEDILWDSVLY